MKDPAPPGSSFRISPLRRSILWLVLGPFLLMGIGMCFSPDSRAAGIYLASLMAVFLALWQWLVSFTRLEISSWGVKLRQLGWKLEAPWEEIDHLSRDKGREGFVVLRPMEGTGARRLAGVSGFGYYGTPMYTDTQRSWMERGQWIPIEPFMYAFHKGPLRERIEESAPGLLGRDPARAGERLAALAVASGPPGQPFIAPLPGRTGLSRLGWWFNALLLTVTLLTLIPASAGKREIESGVAVFLAFGAGPLLTWWTGRLCFRAFRKGSRVWGILLALLTLVAAVFAVQFFHQWLHHANPPGAKVSIFHETPAENQTLRIRHAGLA